jgi:hypothetical protein
MSHQFLTITRGHPIACPYHNTKLENVVDDCGESNLYQCPTCWHYFTVSEGLEPTEAVRIAVKYAAQIWCWTDEPMIAELIEDEFEVGTTFDDPAEVHKLVDFYADKYDLTRNPAA